MTVPLTPIEFVQKWRSATLKEKSAYQSHFIDLCHLAGHLTPVELDPDGKFFTFEAFANKETGQAGFADVWYRGYFALEYKGKHGDLNKAYHQLLQYKDALQNPPLLIVCDLDQIQIHTNFTNTVKRIHTFKLEDLLDPNKLDLLRSIFTRPEVFRSDQTTEQVTRRAAEKFALLAEHLRLQGHEPHTAAHFIIRLLFCLFAEDVDLLPNHIFTRLVQNYRNRPESFAKSLKQLFEAMADGGIFGVEDIYCFDGQLFNDADVLPLNSDALSLLVEVSSLDWSSIEPSILGTLFERSLDPSKRAQLGAHYTSKEDILLIVEPVLMAPLRRKWAEVENKARQMAADLPALKGAKRSKQSEKISQLLMNFADEIAAVTVLDPACGSGNFLYVSLRQLLDLQKAVGALAYELGAQSFYPTVTPVQLFGIEINEYAHQLAEATVWIGYIQWLRENGYGAPPEPILKPLQNIQNMDAVLAYDENGKPVEPDWPAVDVIVGNPPFLGDKKMRAELGDKYVNDLRTLYFKKLPGQIDLVCYWFHKSIEYISKLDSLRVGLLATNSIRHGSSRKVLDKIKSVGNIFFAVSDQDWILDGAALNVSMIGFDNGSEDIKELDRKHVKWINSDLTTSIDVTEALSLAENEGLCFLGVMKSGPFDIDKSMAMEMIAAPINPNNRPNSDVVKKRINGEDIVGRPSNTWIIDFGVNTPIDIASLYEIPFQYVVDNVKPIRDTNRNYSLRTRWWLHGRSRPELREALSNKKRYIATPEVAKHRIFVWMSYNTIPDHTLHVIARDDDYFIGILQSNIHILWSLRIGSTLEDRPRYSSSRVFKTFPFPWPPGKEPQDDPRVITIANAAKALVEKRDAWLNPPGANEAELKKRTLTNLYNQRPTWLDLAHQQLDRAVFAAYGWPYSLTDEEILERLLALNLERAECTKLVE